MKIIVMIIVIILSHLSHAKTEAKDFDFLENWSFIAQGDVFEEGGGLYYFLEHRGWPNSDYSIACVFDKTKHTEGYEEYSTTSNWTGWMLGVRGTKWLRLRNERFEPYLSAELSRASIKTSLIKNVPYNLDGYIGTKILLHKFPVRERELGKSIILSLRTELGAGYVGGDGFSFAPVNLGIEIELKLKRWRWFE